MVDPVAAPVAVDLAAADNFDDAAAGRPTPAAAVAAAVVVVVSATAVAVAEFMDDEEEGFVDAEFMAAEGDDNSLAAVVQIR